MDSKSLSRSAFPSNPTHVRLERFPSACAVLAELEPLQHAGRQLIGGAAILDGIATAGLALVTQARRIGGAQ